ncbi:MAG: prepilin-type N-terminal cleavage/methylation domain-containing protein [Myxococcota bacterium]
MSKQQQGFTLIEMMVAMVIGLTAVTSVYALGSAMSEQFFVEQRVASSQASSRVATLELRRDISRAGLFGTPNASLNTVSTAQRVESTCDPTAPDLPLIGGGIGPLGAFQFSPDEDILVLDPDTNNPDARADRLRILTSLYLTEQLLINSTDPTGTVLVLQDGNQAYRRTFGWGSPAGPYGGAGVQYLNGNLNWQAAWGGETGSWQGIGMRGARAFQAGSMLHIETPEGRHFYRSVFGKAGNVQNEIRLDINPALPTGTACLPGAAEGATVSPLQWVEYAIIDPFAAPDGTTTTDYMDMSEVFFLGSGNPYPEIATYDETDLLESPNRVLVRRILNAADGTVLPNSTQIIAEFVSHFEVSFIIDTRSGDIAQPPNLVLSTDATVINTNPHQVRSVIIDLGIRAPVEDPSLEFRDTGVGIVPTRYEVDPDAIGSAPVRQLHIEVPVMSVGRKNLG